MYPNISAFQNQVEKLPGLSSTEKFCRSFLAHHHQCIYHSLQKYFGVALNDQFFVWTQVPMGFSYSPWIAQSIALMILHFREDDEEAFFDEPHHQQLPDWLSIKCSHEAVDEGFVTVFYDNILLVARNHELGCKIFQRIGRNFTKFGVIMGSWQFLSPRQLRTSTFEYLGAEIKIERKRHRNSTSHLISWRVKPEKVPTKLITRDELKTPRMVAKVIRKLVWRHTLRLIPFSAIYRLIDVLRHAEKHQRATSWDDATFNLNSISCTNQIFVASDSSDNRWGYVTLDPDGSGKEFGSPWSPSDEKLHIYMKELMAACWTIEQFCGSCTNVVIAIDNTAVVHSIQQLYSSNVLANVYLEKLAKILLEAHSRVTVVSVRSGDIAADPASRGKVANHQLRKRCREIMDQKLEGMNQPCDDIAHCPPTAENNRIRHSERPFEDAVDELLECEV